MKKPLILGGFLVLILLAGAIWFFSGGPRDGESEPYLIIERIDNIEDGREIITGTNDVLLLGLKLTNTATSTVRILSSTFLFLQPTSTILVGIKNPKLYLENTMIWQGTFLLTSLPATTTANFSFLMPPQTSKQLALRGDVGNGDPRRPSEFQIRLIGITAREAAPYYYWVPVLRRINNLVLTITNFEPSAIFRVVYP